MSDETNQVVEVVQITTLAKGKNAGPEPGPVPSPAYYASLYPGRHTPLPPALAEALLELEAALQMPLWVIIQNHDGPYGHIRESLLDLFHKAKDEMPDGQRIALFVQSPGGDGRTAYQLGRMLQRRCGGYVAIVAKEAMSAATLLALGADSIVLGADAAIGPLDAQIYDVETETSQSALNEVQALERLRDYAVESLDQLMFHLLSRTGKRIDTILPHALRASVDMMRPLLEKIDVVHYNERARILKVGEEYAMRLLEPKYGPVEKDMPPGLREASSTAERIAAALVGEYPEHPFPIDREEARRIHIDITDATEPQAAILERLWELSTTATAIGRIQKESHRA